MNPTTLLVLSLAALAAGQRPGFAGIKPIGYPEVTQDPLADRFGEIDGTTQRLPVEANGDRELVDRLSKLPIDKQPFWLINWQALEANRQKPQTYPQKPNPFVDPVPSNGGSNSNFNSGNANTNFNSGNISPGFNNVNPNSGTVNSNSGNVNPNSGNVNPNSGNVNTNNGSVNPSNGGVNPNSGNVIPNTPTFNPGVANVNPSFANKPGSGNQNTNSGTTSAQNNGLETSNRFGVPESSKDQDKHKLENYFTNAYNAGYVKPLPLESFANDKKKVPEVQTQYYEKYRF